MCDCDCSGINKNALISAIDVVGFFAVSFEDAVYEKDEEQQMELVKNIVKTIFTDNFLI